MIRKLFMSSPVQSNDQLHRLTQRHGGMGNEDSLSEKDAILFARRRDFTAVSKHMFDNLSEFLNHIYLITY
jgi:hypothetical protein